MYDYLHLKVSEVASKYNERVLKTPTNKISLAMTLSSVSDSDVTFIGSMLFSRGCSGIRSALLNPFSAFPPSSPVSLFSGLPFLRYFLLQFYFLSSLLLFFYWLIRFVLVCLFSFFPLTFVLVFSRTLVALNVS